MKTSKMHNAITMMVLICSLKANALPLLAESAKIKVNEVVVLHPDHQDPNKYYYFPGSSTLVRDKQDIPMFNFVYTGLDKPPADINTPHGYMSSVFRLAPTADQISAINSFLKTNKNAGIAVIPISNGTIELKTDDGGPALRSMFLEFNFPRKGPNTDGEVGINAVLNHFGSKALRSAIMGGGNSFLNTHFCHEYKGLGPVMDATIHVKMDRIYEHYKTEAGASWKFWVRADVAREVEKLKDIRAVSWVINGGDATDREYVTRITNEIITRMFKPELKAEPGAGAQSQGFALFRLSHSSELKTELKEETWNITDREIVTQEYCNTLSFDDVRPYKDKLVTDMDKNNNPYNSNIF